MVPWYSWWVPLGWGLFFTAIGAGIAWGVYEAFGGDGEEFVD